MKYITCGMFACNIVTPIISVLWIPPTYEVCGPQVVTLLDQKRIFERCMARLVIKKN